MTMQEKPKIRLYVPQDFAAGHGLALSAGQSHYLAHVMRLREGDSVAVFNGRDGQWLAAVDQIQKKSLTLRLQEQLCAQPAPCDLWLAFAPIRNKTELVVEKAVELGASALVPVFTRHSVVRSINQEKLEAHAIEAAQQCERFDVPVIEACKDLETLLGYWPQDRLLLYGDESGGGNALATLLPDVKGQKLGVLVGPEGGFSHDEHRMLKAAPFVRPFSMGPRILRADTATVSALACVQAWCGDWDAQPAFAAEL